MPYFLIRDITVIKTTNYELVNINPFLLFFQKIISIKQSLTINYLAHYKYLTKQKELWKKNTSITT